MDVQDSEGGAKTGSGKGRSPLAVIFFTVFVDMVGFGILIPIIPLLLADPTSEFFLLPSSLSVAQGYILLGLMVAVYPLMQFFATPILGQLSDKHGRRWLLAISLAGTAISYVIFAYGIIIRNIPVLFIARALDGITGGNISIAQAAVADITAPKDRAKNFGIIGGAFGLGFIVGPYIGGKLSDPAVLPWFNAATPFWFAALLSAANVVSLIMFLPETLQPHHKRSANIRWTEAITNVKKAFTMKGGLRALFITTFLFFAGFTFYTTFFPVFLIDKFDLSQGTIGDYFSFVGIWVAISQVYVAKKVGRFNHCRIVKYGLFATGGLMLVMLLPPVWWGLLFIVPFFAMAFGLASTYSLGLISASVDGKSQGETLGITASVRAAAQMIPPAIAGVVAAGTFPAAPIVIASAITIAAGVAFWLLYRPSRLKGDPTESPIFC
jgi:DHA1 family tetracycline resistance protein-like MFS transporter